MTVPLSELARELLDANTYATLTTINPDGGPQSSVIWIKRDADDVVFSTIRGRRKTKNMERDPRVSVCMFDAANPYRYVELRGSVGLTEDGGPELIQELGMRYDGVPFKEGSPDNVRVVCRFTPVKVINH